MTPAVVILNSDTSDRARRKLWRSFAWLLAGVIFTIGSVYAAGGLSATAAPDAHAVVTRFIGMRTHGAIMVALSLAFAFGLRPAPRGSRAERRLLDKWARTACTAICGYAVWLVIAFAASWALTGTPTPVPCIWWTAAAVWAAILTAQPPPDPERGRRA